MQELEDREICSKNMFSGHDIATTILTPHLMKAVPICTGLEQDWVIQYFITGRGRAYEAPSVPEGLLAVSGPKGPLQNNVHS